MNNSYVSTAMHLGGVIDARCLVLSVEFFQQDQEAVIDLSRDILRWAAQLVDSAFVVSYQTGHTTGTANRIIEHWIRSIKAGKGCSWGATAFAQCEAVCNRTSMKRHMSAVLRGYHSLTPDVSADFADYWNDVFPGENDRAAIIPAVLALFRQTGKRHTAAYLLPDVQMLFTAIPYERDAQQYYGDFKIHFSRFCLGDHLDRFAGSCCDFARELSEKYININARVQLQPLRPGWRSPYMRYFGQHGMVDDSHLEVGFSAKEWYPTYYAQGVEWFNILSPLTRSHLSDLNDTENLYVRNLAHGGAVVASNKAIESYDVDDALALKKRIYAALYPGRSNISLKTLFRDDPMKFYFAGLPRCDWAIVPLLDNEVTIIGNDLVFRHRG